LSMKKRKASSSLGKSHPQESPASSATPQSLSLPEDDLATPPSIKKPEVFRPWPKGLRFRKSPDGNTSAVVSNSTATEVPPTYFALANDLHLVRTFVFARKLSKSTPDKIEQLVEHLSGTGLAKAADKLDWDNWVDVFSQTNPTRPKAMALMFLRDKTGLTPDTLKTYITRSKKTEK
jgi:hypothetical protein